MVLIRATAMMTTLLIFCLLATDTSAAYYGCCQRYMTKKIPFAAIRGYSAQTTSQNCPVNAIIFHLKKGKACVNPATNWVKEYIGCLKKKAQVAHIKSLLEQQ